MAERIWIIESRNADGVLDFAEPQPESVFGMLAITGITENEMAQRIWATVEVGAHSLHGMNIPVWPSFIDPRWKARRKTW